jgi:MFS family permease
LTFIAADLAGSDDASWIPISYSLAVSSTTPFCGYLQDMFGRRNITIGGGLLLLLGLAVLISASSTSQAISGMAISGAGAAIGELTAIAGWGI